jgi:hypothetical protein
MEFNIEFSRKLIEAAESLQTNGGSQDDTGRAILYLSLLSCEISLKSFLEMAKLPVKDIKKLSHDLAGLLQEIGNYNIEGEVCTGKRGWITATCLRSIVVDSNYSNATVGTLLTAESKQSSKYSNEIRYGDLVKHYNPLVMLKCTKKVFDWVKNNSTSIQKKTKEL